MTLEILRIATRESPLALYQANAVGALLKRNWPTLAIQLVPMTTSGDRFLNNKLQSLGGKGLFVKELEEALLNQQADIAVHSMKDVPVSFPEGLGITTICQREIPFDAFVSPTFNSLSSLPFGARVGTSSLRREAQLRAFRSDFNIQPLRGNVGTRLNKLDQGEYDAIILATAGLCRLNLQTRIQEILSEEIMLPACGQGAIGIECRLDDDRIHAYLKPLHAPLDALCVETERQVNTYLGGGCHTPVAIFCRIDDHHQMTLKAKVTSIDGSIILMDEQRGSSNQAAEMAHRCAEQLIINGANQLFSSH